MFGYILMLEAEIQRQKAEAAYNAHVKEALTYGQYQDYLVKKEVEKIQREKEATIERRHRELCQAIRFTSFWRL